MAKILAIDTSTNACSVALLVGDNIYQDYIVVPQSHTQRLLPMIDKVLSDHQQGLSGLDAIALTTGPGSFTGLRIGLGIAQGLAFGVDVPMIGLSSLQVMAASAKRMLSVADGVSVLPSFDARMSEVYWGQFVFNKNDVEIVVADKVGSASAMLEQIVENGRSIYGVGNGWSVLSEEDLDQLQLNLSEQTPSMSINIEPDFYPHAYDVAELALQKLQQGQGQSALEINPVYIRNEVSWKKRQKIRQ